MIKGLIVLVLENELLLVGAGEAGASRLSQPFGRETLALNTVPAVSKCLVSRERTQGVRA